LFRPVVPLQPREDAHDADDAVLPGRSSEEQAQSSQPGGEEAPAGRERQARWLEALQQRRQAPSEGARVGPRPSMVC